MSAYSNMSKAALIAELEARDARKADRAAQVSLSMDEARAASGLVAPCGRSFVSQKGLDGHIAWSKGNCAGLVGHGHGPRD